LIHVGGLDGGIVQRTDGVEALVVGEDQENVAFHEEGMEGRLSEGKESVGPGTGFLEGGYHVDGSVAVLAGMGRSAGYEEVLEVLA
jgi:hypothetical protein